MNPPPGPPPPTTSFEQADIAARLIAHQQRVAEREVGRELSEDLIARAELVLGNFLGLERTE